MIFCQIFRYLVLTKYAIIMYSPQSFLDLTMARISGVNIPTNKKVNIALLIFMGSK